MIVPVIINELYKMDGGYITLWGAADVLAYYGILLGAFLTVLSLIITIHFTKKQIQRESYLNRENEKWRRIETTFSDILLEMNPITVLDRLMDNTLADSSEQINILQKYRMKCRTVTDRLCGCLSIIDYPKVAELIKSIQSVSKQYDELSEKLIEQYTCLRNLSLRECALKMLELVANDPTIITPEELLKHPQTVKETEGIQAESVYKTIQELNTEWIEKYEKDYLGLLKQKGATFECIYNEININADAVLHIWEK